MALNRAFNCMMKSYCVTTDHISSTIYIPFFRASVSIQNKMHYLFCSETNNQYKVSKNRMSAHSLSR